MFRALIRSLATLIAAVGVATCADAPSTAAKPPGGGRVAARLGFEPVFSAAARAAAARLADFGIVFDHVRIVIVRPVADTVKDTTITFVPGQPDVKLDLSVAVLVDGESFRAAIDYTNPTGVVFHGEGTVQSHPPDQAAPAQQITVEYIGPGATVVRIVVSPKTTSVVSPATVTLTVAGFDANNAPVSGTPINWTVSDPTLATISSSGVLTPTTKRGTVTVTATTPNNITDNATVAVRLPPSNIVLVSGGGQTGKAGTALAQPAVVRVTASDGVGVAGITVNFAPPTGGQVGTPSIQTDANGSASTSLTLGSAVGPQAFVAVAQGFSVSIPATATVGDAATIVAVSGGGQADTVKHTLKLPLVAKVTDQFGNAAGGVTVNWQRTGGTGALSGPTSVTSPDGFASIGYTLGAASGSETISASVSGATTVATFTVTALAGPAAAIAIVSGNTQTGRILQPLSPFVVKVTDDAGNPVSGATVTWTGTNGTLSATTTTDLTGQSSNTMTLGTTTGGALATATVAGKTVTFAATVQVGIVAKMALQTGPPAIAAAGAPITPAIQVALQDAGGNLTAAANAVTIALGANQTGATLTGTLTRNAVGGIATFDDLKVDKVGVGYTLVVTSNGVASVTSGAFNVVPGAAGSLVIITGDAQTGLVNTLSTLIPSVKLLDVAGNPIPGAPVTYAPAQGSGTVVPATPIVTDALGVATLGSWTYGILAGAQSLVVSSPGAPSVTIHATTLAGAATRYVVVAVLPTTIAGGTASVTAQLIDAFNNPVSASGHTVNWTSTNGGSFATPSNTTGLTGATPPMLFTTSTTAGVTHTITATDAQSPSLTGTATVTTLPGLPSRLFIATLPTTALSGIVFGAQPVIQLQDANGNPSPQSGVTVNAAIATGGGTLGGTTTAVTDVAGRATFTNLSLSGIIGPRTLAFTSTGLTGATSAAITLAAGAPAKLAFFVNPAGAQANLPITPSIQVGIQDAAGNTVATAANSVALAITSGTGTVGALLVPTTPTVVAINGVATFPGVSIDLPGTGYMLTATSAGLTAGVSTAFNIITPPLSLTFVTPAAVDAVFATVPIKLAGTNFQIGGTTVAVTGGSISTANTVVQSSDTLTTNFIITGGAATATVGITATISAGVSNQFPFALYSVGTAPVQLGTANGGTGGAIYNLDCPVGMVGTGLNAAGGTNVDRIEVICQPVTGANRIFGSSTGTGFAGGTGGTPQSLACPANSVLVGITGFLGSGGTAFNDQIQGICAPIGGGTLTVTGFVGSQNSGAIPYSSTCPAGLAVVGITGGAGGLVDRTQIKCR